jgi:elongation factor 1 alpha-like protein
MQRVKKIDYDEDDFYSEEEEAYPEAEQESYTDEDRHNFATLTPVVRAELDEAGLQASDREIEDSLWHYYWDVGKSVAYLKNTRTPRTQEKKGKEKPKSKFDQAAEKSAVNAGEWAVCSSFIFEGGVSGLARSCMDRRGGLSCLSCTHVVLTIDPADQALGKLPLSSDWFHGVPWSNVPPEMEGHIVPVIPSIPRPRLLGGSSKLAKLAEERRKKAATSPMSAPAPEGALSSLDRLSKPKDTKENVKPQTRSEPKKYPIRKKSEPAPPPREPTPPPQEPIEEVPDLRASPTAFGRTLSTSPSSISAMNTMAVKDMLNSSATDDPFKGPSPDDAVLRAQQNSKGLTK